MPCTVPFYFFSYDKQSRDYKYCSSILKEIQRKAFEQPLHSVIESWTMLWECPTMDEIEYEFGDYLKGMFDTKYETFLKKNMPSFNDKLHGYAPFQNDYIYPKCPQCKQDMKKFVYAHNGLITKCEFGGVNPMGYIFVCEEHPFVVSFGYSSFGNICVRN